MIDLKLLEILDTFAACGTLTQAAEKLHTSQPSLTRSMMRLEDDLGVSLFVRRRNHLSLTPTGQKAAEYAHQLLLAASDFEERILAFDRSLHTLSIGFCAPIPQQVLTPIISASFSGMTLSSDMMDDARFLDYLEQGIYQLAVMHEAPSDSRFFWKKVGHEDLFITVIPQHPLAVRDAVSLADLDGLTLLLVNDIGFWANMHRLKTPRTRYLHQRDLDSVWELAVNTPYPIFSSGYRIRRGDSLPGRVNIPITDPEAHTDFFLVCLAADKEKYLPLFRQVHDRTIW